VSSWINTTTLKACGDAEGFFRTFTGSPFTRDPYVGEFENNETDHVGRC
jgi:hypothetical protein